MTCRRCRAPIFDRDPACVACGAPLYVVEPFVEIISGPLDGVGRSIPPGGFVIGRASDRAELAVPDPAVSRAHTRITREASACFLEDLGSSSGTLVDGVRIHGRVPLQHGAIIEIGNTRLVCYLPTAGASPEAALVPPRSTAG